MSDYVPTTKTVKDAYVWAENQPEISEEGERFASEAFDRWLRDHDAEVLERAAKALQTDGTAEPGSRKRLYHGIYARWLEDRALKIAEGKLTDV